MEIRADQGLAGLLAAGLAFGAMQAMADDSKFDLYVGLGGDQATAKDRIGFGEGGEGGGGGHANLKFDTIGKMGLVGFMFMPCLGVEAQYHVMDSTDERFNFRGIKVDLDQATIWTGSLIAKMPVGPVNLFAKLGGESHDAKESAHLISTGEKVAKHSDNGQELAYGGGVEVNVQMISFRAEYQYLDIADGVGIWSLEGIWHFHL